MWLSPPCAARCEIRDGRRHVVIARHQVQSTHVSASTDRATVRMGVHLTGLDSPDSVHSGEKDRRVCPQRPNRPYPTEPSIDIG